MSVFPWRARRSNSLVCFILAHLFSASAPAAIVHGTVTDPLGAAVPGAVVALVEDGKVITNTRSDAAGGFTLSSGGSGRFYVLASAPTV